MGFVEWWKTHFSQGLGIARILSLFVKFGGEAEGQDPRNQGDDEGNENLCVG